MPERKKTMIPEEFRQTISGGSPIQLRVEVDGPRWVVEKELGRGGMGRVDLVFDRTLQRRLAMKRLLVCAVI